MTTPETVKAQIREAFAASQYPGDHRLRGSDEGDEPFDLEREFRGRRDWQSLSPEFIDRAPKGLATALNFFSHEAFRFYLPAYLAEVADAVGATRIVPVHWDDFTRPLDEPLRPMPVAVRLDTFFSDMQRLRPDLAVQTLELNRPVALFPQAAP